MLRFLRVGFFAGLSGLCLSACDQTDESPAVSAIPEGFELVEGFSLTLVASEPLIADPVDMEIDEYGNLFVVEMPGYPLDTSGSGRVKKLTDSNGDGRMDTATLFADGLNLPTGIMRWKQGVLVVDTPHVLYLEDTTGDGHADKREVVLTGFAVSNPQHNVNNPELGLDNWIYLGHEPAITTNLYPEEFGDGGSEVHRLVKLALFLELVRPQPQHVDEQPAEGAHGDADGHLRIAVVFQRLGEHELVPPRRRRGLCGEHAAAGEQRQAQHGGDDLNQAIAMHRTSPAGRRGKPRKRRRRPLPSVP